jgi:hypothetical protein
MRGQDERKSRGRNEKRGYQTAFRPPFETRIPGSEDNYAHWPSRRKGVRREDGSHQTDGGIDSLGGPGKEIQHRMPRLLRQSVYASLAGYDDINDHER